MEKRKKNGKMEKWKFKKMEKKWKLETFLFSSSTFFSLKNQGSLFDTKIALCDNCMTMHALKPFDDFMTKLVWSTLIIPFAFYGNFGRRIVPLD